MHMQAKSEGSCSSCGPKKRTDWLLWGTLLIVAIGYLTKLFFIEQLRSVLFLPIFVESIFTLMNAMWSGILFGIVFVGILANVPRSLVQATIGKSGTISGIFRATAGGVLLDLCSHGILLVGMQLYKKGASLGQVMAFLIASPWNSFSLTFILWSLIGLPWTLAVIVLSMAIALVSGIIFDQLVRLGVLPKNPHEATEAPLPFRATFANYWASIQWKPANALRTLVVGLRKSRMILRWVFFGVVLSALLRTFIAPELFTQLFGPTVAGLGATLLFATILEVCSEGSMPIAADFFLRAKAPGNTFAFLMTGVATDYTEILSLKETTSSWKIALFLPLVTVPQVVLIALLLNKISI